MRVEIKKWWSGGIKTDLTVCVKEVREIICLCVNVSIVDGGDTEATVTSYLRLS